MAKEVSEEAAHEFQASNYKHINLEAVAIVIKGVLDGIIKSIVTNLSKAEDNKGKKVFHFSKSVLNFLRLFLLLIRLSFDPEIS
jgi:hypothetical protein